MKWQKNKCLEKRMIKLDKQNLISLKGVAQDIRYDVLTMCHNCGKQKGHLGGCMSAVEILTTLYCRETNLKNAVLGEVFWEDRDRVFLSKGHASLAMYSAMKHAGLVSQEMIEGEIRGENSVLFRHSKRNTDIAIEYSSGSLGLGLGFGIGVLEGLKRKNSSAKVYVIIGDGECNEGSVWESAAYAGAHHLENLIVIIDKNNLQLDGFTKDVLEFGDMAEKWKSFGFETIEADGHDFESLSLAFATNHKNKPLAIIANTVKGKGVSFAENKAEWHGNYLDDASYYIAIDELGVSSERLKAREEAKEIFKKQNRKFKNSNQVEKLANLDFSPAYWNSFCGKSAIGEVAYEIVKQNKNVVLVYSDCGRRIQAEKIEKNFPDNAIQVGISEQNQILISAGLASEGFRVIAVSYAPFITGRVYDQLHLCVGYMKLPLTFVGIGAGFDSSDLGSTHTMFTDIGLMSGLGEIDVCMPKNSLDIAQMILESVNKNKSSYIRVTTSEISENILVDRNNDSFNKVSIIGESKNCEIGILAVGALCYEAVKAQEILKKDGLNVVVVMLPKTSLINLELCQFLSKKKTVYVLEEHNEMFGIKSILLNELSNQNLATNVKSIAVKTNYFIPDIPLVLKEKCGLTANGIVNLIKKEKCEN